jgi:hypothetical protein
VTLDHLHALIKEFPLDTEGVMTALGPVKQIRTNGSAAKPRARVPSGRKKRVSRK